jgi:hypothetical protein
MQRSTHAVYVYILYTWLMHTSVYKEDKLCGNVEILSEASKDVGVEMKA